MSHQTIVALLKKQSEMVPPFITTNVKLEVVCLGYLPTAKYQKQKTKNKFQINNKILGALCASVVKNKEKLWNNCQ